ncbi:hypothetical protein BY458DRAFT_528140 [Sporodiniella umbellata]|nr:hypothetical protein BY458DRAFT_528140 [Sporodiniella umbellata]
MSNNHTDVSDDAVLEFMFNPEAQGLSLDTISNTIKHQPKYAISAEMVSKLEGLEKECVRIADSENDLEKALKVVNQCIELEPKYASAYNNRAQIYRLQQQPEKALEDLERVIGDLGEGQPKILRQAYTQRAILKRQAGDLVGSRKDFETGAQLGNAVARNVTVQENPYAKMCNQVMMQVMQRECSK